MDPTLRASRVLVNVKLALGEVEFVISGGPHPTRELLRPGDSVYFHTEYPHQISGVSKSPFATHTAEAIALFWSPFGDPGLVPASRLGASGLTNLGWT